jgi:hypothetical protein
MIHNKFKSRALNGHVSLSFVTVSAKSLKHVRYFVHVNSVITLAKMVPLITVFYRPLSVD